MPVDYFYASGWTPRGHDEDASRRALGQWLETTVRSGEFGHRSPMAPSPFHWSFEQTPRQTVAGLPAGGRRLLSVEQSLWNFMAIPAGTSRSDRRPFTTKGYVTCRDVMEFGGTASDRSRPIPPRAGAGHSPQFRYWDSIRCLPETDGEALAWGYTRANRTQWQVIVEEGRRYNATIRSRLVAGYSAGRAHASAVRDMQAQSQQLIMQAAFEIALSVGSSPAMNFAPAISDFAGRSGATMQDVVPIRDF